MAKPVVDRLGQELEGRAEVIRIDVMSRLGNTLAQRYGVRAIPTFLLFDGNGQVIYTQVGIPNRAAILEAVATVAPR